MALKVIVKNTFLDVDETEEHAAACKRSSSLPREWKPCHPFASGGARPRGPPSLASTSVSDGESSDACSRTESVTPRDLPGGCEEGLTTRQPVPKSPEAPAQKGPGAPAGAAARRQPAGAPAGTPAATGSAAADLPTWAGKWNLNAAEFKMPTQSSLDSGASPTGACLAVTGVWRPVPVPTQCTITTAAATTTTTHGLNPNAPAFEIGASAFVACPTPSATEEAPAEADGTIVADCPNCNDVAAATEGVRRSKC